MAPGADMRVSAERSEAARNFANKVWNAARFVLMNLKGEVGGVDPAQLNAAEKWILSRMNRAIRTVTQHLQGNDLGLAAQAVYDFAWSEFCDWYIEL
ncbi:class I tRNA ligase family protein, partial [Escherichia coli]